MELDRQQLKRLRERHHRRHGIRPAHSEAAEQAGRFLKRAFNIREGRAPYHVIRKRFVNGARLTGSHLCILIIAMLIASIGLDIDSDIAIVGAMLICPLMGSVLAMAYGIATLDREITVEAVAGLALQMVFCLVTSTLYFKLSPLGTTTAAIIDNSTPTVWDLTVALAGGFAGGLGNSRDQEPATLIAGVAVATALMPPLCAACILQDKLGVPGCPAFDVQAVCAGFIYALSTANAYIRSGMARTALVVGAEIFSRILDWNDRSTCVLFGDGAGAVILQASEQPGILGVTLQADGRYQSILNVPAQVAGGEIVGTPFLHMDGGAVFKFAVKALADCASKTLAAQGMSHADLDWLVPHQANVRIIESTAKHLKLSMDKVIVTVDRHGNTSAASIPLALDEGIRSGRIQRGQKLLLEGIGGGFTWGAALIQY